MFEIWMDKRGFRIGFEKARLIATMDPNKLLFMIDLENCDYICKAATGAGITC